MAGILLIYFIWKHYSELAGEHNKSKWGYALLGIATYYAGAFTGGVAISIIDIVADTHFVEESNDIVLSLISIPFGLLFVWGLFKVLETKWKTQKNGYGDALDHEFIDSNGED